MRRIGTIALVLALAVAIPACGDDDDSASSSAPEEQSVDVGGHTLHLVCQGSGSPTVLIEMGGGQKVTSWNGTQAEMAATNRTCVYERAGIGESEPGPEPRTAEQIVDELESLITAAEIEVPLVLVSHSIGGMYAELFAAEHPDQVSGLVFIDPRTSEFQLGYRDLLTPEELEADQADIDAVASEPVGPEIVALDDSAEQVAAAGPLPDVPVIVLTAGITDPGGNPAVDTFWQETHQNLAAEVTNGEERVVQAEHEIWRTNSQDVVDAVADVQATS
jgi:pimeloyl-ACP methyl ester carboxylesterase